MRRARRSLALRGATVVPTGQRRRSLHRICPPCPRETGGRTRRRSPPSRPPRTTSVPKGGRSRPGWRRSDDFTRRATGTIQATPPRGDRAEQPAGRVAPQGRPRRGRPETGDPQEERPRPGHRGRDRPPDGLLPPRREAAGDQRRRAPPRGLPAAPGVRREGSARGAAPGPLFGVRGGSPRAGRGGPGAGPVARRAAVPDRRRDQRLVGHRDDHGLPADGTRGDRYDDGGGPPGRGTGPGRAGPLRRGRQGAVPRRGLPSPVPGAGQRVGDDRYPRMPEAGAAARVAYIEPGQEGLSGFGSGPPGPAAAERRGLGSPRHSPARAVGRNDTCPCGSGKKFKRCCGNRQ
ncbi:MAG: SEC-C metal-binding domain-containing protein [Gemmataceae bacterium]